MNTTFVSMTMARSLQKITRLNGEDGFKVEMELKELAMDCCACDFASQPSNVLMRKSRRERLSSSGMDSGNSKDYLLTTSKVNHSLDVPFSLLPVWLTKVLKDNLFKIKESVCSGRYKKRYPLIYTFSLNLRELEAHAAAHSRGVKPS